MHPIRELMEKQGLRIGQLAELSGIDRTAIWKHISGERKPDLERCRRYAQAFGLSIDDFVGRIDNHNS